MRDTKWLYLIIFAIPGKIAPFAIFRCVDYSVLDIPLYLLVAVLGR